MSSKPVRIAQISDLHIKSAGSLAYGRVDTAKALERCIAALNEFEPAPDFDPSLTAVNSPARPATPHSLHRPGCRTIPN